MFEKFHHKTVTASLAAMLAALGVGGIAVAQNNASSTTPPATATPAPSTAQADTPESANDKADANDPADANDKAEANDPADANEKPGTESATDSDGPNGHADEATGNADANTQQQGQN